MTRDEALRRVRGYLTDLIPIENYDEVEEIMLALEQTRWIPVSERLPKKTGWYLITFKTANGVAVCELSYRKPENYWTDKDISKKVLDNSEVIAWMALPEPYKAESEE